MTRQKTVKIGGMPRALPAVRFSWKRTPEDLWRTFCFSMGGAKPEEIQETQPMLASIRRMRCWAFCDTTAKPPVVHFWAGPRVSRARLAYVLGHEVGHVSGRPLRSMKNAWAEELRADQYGGAAFLAFQHVMRKGRR